MEIHPSTYYQDRYGLGLGWMFGFPSVQIEHYISGINEKEKSEQKLYYHDGAGGAYEVMEDTRSLPDEEKSHTNLKNYFTDNVVFQPDDTSYTGEDCQSKYSFTRADGTKEYFGDQGELLAIRDRFANEITFDYKEVEAENILPYGNFHRYVRYNGFTAEDKDILTFSGGGGSGTRGTGTSPSIYLYGDCQPLSFSMLYNAGKEGSGFDGTVTVEYNVYAQTGKIYSAQLASFTPVHGDTNQRITGEFVPPAELSGTPKWATLTIEANGTGTISFADVRLSPKRKMLQSITDTYGRTLTFDYEDTRYNRVQDAGSVTVYLYAPGSDAVRKTIRYDRKKISCVQYRDLYCNTIWAEHHFYQLTGCDNGEYYSRVGYDEAAEYSEMKYVYPSPPDETGMPKVNEPDYLFFSPQVLSSVSYRNSVSHYSYTMVTKCLGGGYIKGFKVSGTYETDLSSDGKESTVHKNSVSYSYMGGHYSDETGWGFRPSTSKYVEPAIGWLDPMYGTYNVNVYASGHGKSEYRYVDVSGTSGNKYLRAGAVPRLIYEAHEDENGTVVREMEEFDVNAITSPTRIKETKNNRFVTYQKYAYDLETSFPSMETLPLTEEEAELKEIPEEKKITTEYRKFDGTRIFLPVRTTMYQNADTKLVETTAYDDECRVVSETNAADEEVFYEYGDIRFPWAVTRQYGTDPENRGDEKRQMEVLYEYGEYDFGPIRTRTRIREGEYEETETEYEPLYGNVTGTADALGNRTSYTYDHLYRPIQIVYPSINEGSSTRYVRDVIAYTESEEQEGYLRFKVQTKREQADNPLFTDAETLDTTTGYYDDNGYLYTETTNKGTERYVYDAYSRVTGYQNYMDSVSGKNTTTYEYDTQGRIIQVRDQSAYYYMIQYLNEHIYYSFGKERTNMQDKYWEEYDCYGNLVKEKITTSRTIPSTYITREYIYDQLGNLLTEKDGNGKIISYEYDKKNQVTCTRYPDGQKIRTAYNRWGTEEDTYRGESEWAVDVAREYDDRGLETGLSQKGDGIYAGKWQYGYDTAGRLTRTTTPNGTLKSYAYDPSGNLTHSYIGNEILSYQYNGNGQVENQTRYRNGKKDGEGRYEYNNSGQLTKKTIGEDTTLYTSNALDALTGMTSPGGFRTTYAYDDLNRLKTIQAGGEKFQYTYTPEGMVESITYPNTEIKTTYEYDGANRLTSMVTKNGDAVIRKYQYTYDGNSNILSVSGSENVTYEYDSRNRLIWSGQDGDGIEYTYDVMDNVCDEFYYEDKNCSRSVYYNYTGDNRLYTRRENWKSDGLVQYEFDLNGNLTGDSEGNIYRYDSNDYLVYSKVNGVETTYTIGLDGYRSSKTTGNTTTYYKTNESGQVIEEVKETLLEDGETQTETTEYVWDGNHPLAMKTGGSTYYYVYNAHGDVTALISWSGNIVNEYEYDAWGAPTIKKETVENPLLYAGEYYDKETGLIYLRARYYSPELKMFIQEDPARNGINWYSYCENNPVNRRDNNGLASERIENASAKFRLIHIAYKQYPLLYVRFIDKKIAKLIDHRIRSSIFKVTNNRKAINSVAIKYGVPNEIIGGIIFKEQLTQSLPDFVANIDTFLGTNNHSTGLGAIFPKTARAAWNKINPDVVKGVTDDQLQYRLTYDDDFNIETIAVVLIYEAMNEELIKYPWQAKDLPRSQWKGAVKRYNGADEYANKVYEYLDSIEELLD